MAETHVIVTNAMGAVFFLLGLITSRYIPAWTERPSFWFAYSRAMSAGFMFAGTRTLKLVFGNHLFLHLVEVFFAGIFAVLLMVTGIFWALSPER